MPQPMGVCRVCWVTLTVLNHYVKTGKICKECDKRRRRPLTCGTNANSIMTEGQKIQFGSKQEKREFVLGRRSQAKYSGPKIAFSSYVGQEAGECSACGGTIRRDSRNFQCCENCGLQAEGTDDYNIIENCHLHIKYERKNQKYLNQVPRREEAFNEEESGTYDKYYNEIYEGRGKDRTGGM
jgi:hypothetical protein